jgi:hypothetical protein
VPNKSRYSVVRKVMINSFSPTGSNSALVIGAYA